MSVFNFDVIGAITGDGEKGKDFDTVFNKNLKDGMQIHWVRENVKDKTLAEEMFLTLIQDNPKMLIMLEENEKTASICETAFNADISLMEHIPNEYITENMHTKLLKSDPDYFRKLPNEMKTEEACLSAIKANPDNLAFIPEDKKTPAILKATFEAMRNKK